MRGWEGEGVGGEYACGVYVTEGVGLRIGGI